MSTRIGVDIGGTFTDLVYYDDTEGAVVVNKVPTTPSSPESGCINAVNTGVPASVLSDASYFLHGTTVGLNALLERRGAKVGLLTTAGFRDVLELRDGSRGEPYNVFWRPKAPLVPRDLRFDVRERCTFDGNVQTPLVAEDIGNAYEHFCKEGVSSIAIVFLHSYANPSHELEAERILREAGFDGYVSMSHVVSGEYRDYERTSTTVIDAFVRARMSRYLTHIETTLEEEGFDGIYLMTRSGSGSMTFSEAQQRPFETIMSGPVAGAEGAAELSRRLDIPNIITADVGGTSFDAALVVDGRPRLLHSGEVDGMPIQSPWVDVRSIGAGGGSIASVDAGGLICVGPQSAGAEPGPACYGRGGTRPTTTDAACYLGMLGEGTFDSGLGLDRYAAERALATLSEPLGCSVEDAAKGVIKIVGSHMASIIRELTIEQGIDPREFKLLPFGGAGPMMATQIARELEIAEVIIPPHAGNFSAWGLLGADLMRSRSRTLVRLMSPETVEAANKVLSELMSAVMADSIGGEELEEKIEPSLELRYNGQEHTLSIKPPHLDGQITISANEIVNLFHETYAEKYGGTLDSLVELVNVRISRRRALPRREENNALAQVGTSEEGQYFSLASDKRMTFAIRHRGDLVPGERHAGPAIISEPTTTTYVDADFDYGVNKNGCLVLQRISVKS